MANDRSRTSITANELNDLLEAGNTIQIIDVTAPAEYRAAHVSGAQNVPLQSDELNAMMNDRDATTPPLYVMCAGGVRSKMVCAQFPDAYLINVQGGKKQWIKDKLPLLGEGGASSAACPICTIVTVAASYFNGIRRSLARPTAN